MIEYNIIGSNKKMAVFIINEKDNNFENEYDSLKDVVEFQNNMYNPGHYIGTGKVPPTVSAPGNATPMAVMCFFGAVVVLALGLLLILPDTRVTSCGLIDSPIINKIIAFIIMLGISAFFMFFGFVYLRKAKKYYKQKTEFENLPIDENIKDEIWQRTCPKCATSHDIDYPKCPNCKFNYLEHK